MTETLEDSPLWPATLDHIRYESPDAARLADFHSRALGMSTTKLGASGFLLEAPSRSIVIGAAKSVSQPYAAFALIDSSFSARVRGLARQSAAPRRRTFPRNSSTWS